MEKTNLQKRKKRPLSAVSCAVEVAKEATSERKKSPHRVVTKQ